MPFRDVSHRRVRVAILNECHVFEIERQGQWMQVELADAQRVDVERSVALSSRYFLCDSSAIAAASTITGTNAIAPIHIIQRVMRGRVGTEGVSRGCRGDSPSRLQTSTIVQLG